MLTSLGYAVKTVKSGLAPYRFEPRDPGAHEVQIEIMYCGVCHSDFHTARDERHNTVYPLVPGHEIIGHISKVGSHVKQCKETPEMLDFCVEHGITSDIEMIKIQDNNIAYERMLKNDVRHRFVIDEASPVA